MRIQLDTKDKTIKLQEDVKISDLVQELKDLLDIDWDNYTLIMEDNVGRIHKNIPPTYTPPNNPDTDPYNPPNIYC